jgi:hypothetical protein
MNTANLQLEGLYAAMAALIDALKEKGVVSSDEIDRALRDAEHRLAHESDRNADLSDANVNAILFPVRMLRLFNECEGDHRSFAELAAQVGRDKSVEPHAITELRPDSLAR